MGVEKQTSPAAAAVVLLMVMVMGPLGVAGQGQRRGDVCFPGEGDLVTYPINPSFPRTVERFSYSFFDMISSQQGERSMVVSPYSVWSVLSLAYFGSLGVTQTELQNALGYQNKTFTLSNFNAIKFYLEDGAGNAALKIVTKGYFSHRLQLNRCLSNEFSNSLSTVDFSQGDKARRSINQEISDVTQGRIQELITFLPASTRFALINAVFFKGDWVKAFNANETRPQQFLIPPGRSSGVVQMMNRVDMMTAGEAGDLDAKMVEMPYKGSNISMYLLLPNNPLAATQDLVSRLNGRTFATAVRSLPKQQVLVSLSVPKFKMESRFEQQLQQALASMGVTSLFDASRSNLQGFAASPPLHVDTAIHKATLEVNEEGTVATAATVLINTRIGPTPKLTLAFNRPFVFLIVEKSTRIPLFMGKVTSANDLQDL